MKVRVQGKRRMAWLGKAAHHELKWQLVIDRCMASIEAQADPNREARAREMDEFLENIFRAATPIEPRLD